MSQSDRSRAVRAAAHEYANLGWHVLQLHSVGNDGQFCSCNRGGRCTSKGKHPIDTGWQKSSKPSGPDIEALWDAKPYANVGLATGDASGFWVLDIDPEHGGREAYQALTAEHGRVDRTYAVQTGSGGWHFYFAMPDFPVTNSAKRLPVGIDVRGSGGQVVAPPSRTDKGEYRATPHELAQAPDWLLDLVRPAEAPVDVVTTTDLPDRSHLSDAERARLDAYATRAVAGNVDRLKALAPREPYDGEPWNHTTFEVACSLLELQNSPWNEYVTAHADLLQYAPKDAGFGVDAIEKCWASAVARVGNKARPLPEDRSSRHDDDDLLTGPLAGPVVLIKADTPIPPRGIGPDTDDWDDPATPPEPTEWDFFGGPTGKDFLAARLANTIMSRRQLAWGRDESFWAYDEAGVWLPERRVVIDDATRLLGDRYRPAMPAAASDIIRAQIPRLECGPTTDYINFTNGMLPWAAGDELVKHDPGYHSTVQLPVHYDPTALCPVFDDWLASVLEPDYVTLAWEMIGYLMMSGNPVQVAFMLYGTGGNGKGTLIRVIEALLGSANYATESLDDLNGNRFSAINLFGKLANLAGDIDASYQESTANFKKLTGEDQYAGERKYGDRFTFESWAVPLFSANKIPGSADVSYGYLRRWVMLHFKRTITNPTAALSDHLSDEIPGIAAHGVRALRGVMQRNGFTVEGEAAKGKAMFAEHVDQVRQWVKAAAVLIPTGFASREDLYSLYTTWANEHGHGKLRDTEFFHRLEGIGLTPGMDKEVAGYYGVMVLMPQPDPVVKNAWDRITNEGTD